MGGKAARERIDRRDVVFARERLRLFWGAPERTLVSVVELPRHREIGGEDIEGRVEIDGRGLGKRRLDGSERRRDDIDKKARLHAFAARARRREDDLVTAHRESVDAFGKGELRRDLGSGVFRPLGVRARDREPRKQRFELRRREDAFGGREGGAHRRERAQNEGIGAARRRDLIGGGIGEKARSRARCKDAALRRGDAHLARERVYQDALSGGEIEVARHAARGVARDARSARKLHAARGIHAAAVARGGVIGDLAARHRKGSVTRKIHAAAVAARRISRDGATRHHEGSAVGDIDRRAVLRAVGGEIAARKAERRAPLHAHAAAREFPAAAAARIGQREGARRHAERPSRPAFKGIAVEIEGAGDRNFRRFRAHVRQKGERRALRPCGKRRGKVGVLHRAAARSNACNVLRGRRSRVVGLFGLFAACFSRAFTRTFAARFAASGLGRLPLFLRGGKLRRGRKQQEKRRSERSYKQNENNEPLPLRPHAYPSVFHGLSGILRRGEYHI